MTLLPPEVSTPFRSQREREQAEVVLRQRCAKLVRLSGLAARPADQWSAEAVMKFPATTNGVADPAPRRLARWLMLFQDEIRQVTQVAGDPQPLGDVELREAVYIAGKLVAIAAGVDQGEVDSFEPPE